MMKNRFFKRVALAAMGLTFVTQSCTDLEPEIYSEITADNFFKTDAEYIAALGQAYTSFQGIGNHSNLWSTNELSSDELVVTTKGADWFDGGVLLQLHSHDFQPQNGFFNNTWGQIYGAVNTCNRLLATFEAIGTPEAEAFIAEIRGVRALWYYWAMDAFGNVPLVTSFEQTDPPSNSSRQEVYAFVESELNDIIPLLPTQTGLATYGRMTKWVALAVRCKLYLNAEVYTGTAQWAKAEADAEEIINNGGYSLEPLYADNFAINNQGSSENIFAFPYDKTFANGFNWPMMTFHYASQGVFQFTAQPWNGYSAVEEFYNSYIDPVKNPGPQGRVWKGLAVADPADAKIPHPTSLGTLDERLSNFIVGPQWNPDGSRALDPGYDRADPALPEKEADPDGEPLTFTPQHNEVYPFGWRQGGARIGKYEIEQGGTDNMSNDFVIFRLGDIILALAEAKWRQSAGDAEALALVNQIRARAGVDPYVSLDADKLLAERGREMFAEMVRRQDLIRFNKYGIAGWPTSGSYAKIVHDNAYSHYRNIFPIPQNQLDLNDNLEQNPGY
jgi:starch-binding outer membrane protein, SusD/RagB family